MKKDEAIDLPDESVDAVLLFAALTCIRSDEEQAALVGEISRVLKPGGVLYGTYGVFELPEGAVCRHHSEEYIFRLLDGFAKKEYAPITFTTMNGHRADGFYYIGQK